MSVCMYDWLCRFACIVFAFMYVCICIHTYVCIYVCTYVYISMYICMCICIHASGCVYTVIYKIRTCMDVIVGHVSRDPCSACLYVCVLLVCIRI
jgi:hypothetical protein